MEFVPKQLEAMAKLYRERNSVYKDNYKKIGHFMEILFPDGINLSSPEEYNRFSILLNVVAKFTRYCANWETGHQDSLNDICVYSMMLQELDDEYL